MIGNFNPCYLMSLLDESGRVIGYCYDSPNSFAYACMQSSQVFRGMVNDDLFGISVRIASLPDNQDRIRMLQGDAELCSRLKESIILL